MTDLDTLGGAREPGQRRQRRGDRRLRAKRRGRASLKSFGSDARAGKTFRFHVLERCGGRTTKKTFKLVFDAEGGGSRSKTDLNGDGKKDG